METFGKSGCRRIVPGQMLAADPKGRAVMIGTDEQRHCNRILTTPYRSRREAEVSLCVE